jgi:TonB family protein
MRIVLVVLLFCLWMPLRAQIVFPLDPASTPDRVIYLSVQQQPEFPGGLTKLTEYVHTNLHYPLKARKDKRQGRVFLNFIISERGRIENVRLLKGVDPSLDAEAVRMVRSMPKWKPGRIGGQAVSCRYYFPVQFSL